MDGLSQVRELTMRRERRFVDLRGKCLILLLSTFGDRQKPRAYVSPGSRSISVQPQANSDSSIPLSPTDRSESIGPAQQSRGDTSARENRQG
jgi:hypothetical protein